MRYISVTGRRAKWNRPRWGPLVVFFASHPDTRRLRWVFLGLAETAEDFGPLGVPVVSRVRHSSVSHYEDLVDKGLLCGEEIHGGVLYFATRKSLSVSSGSVSAMVEVTERYKAHLRSSISEKEP